MRITTGCVLFLALFAAGCDGDQSASKSAPKTDPVSKTDPPMSATKLATEYANDKAAADKLYQFKSIRVAGIVKTAARKEGSSTFLVLEGTKTVSVSFEFGTANAKSIQSLRPGQRVVVKGACVGLINPDTVDVSGCELSN